MGNRRNIRRFRIVASLVLVVPILVFSQSEYQITSIPKNVISMASHNGFDAFKKNNHYYINSDNNNIDSHSLSLLQFPARIHLINYSSNNLNISFLDYGTFKDQIDNQLLNQFTSYEFMIKLYFQNNIKNLFFLEYSFGGLYSKIDYYTSSIILSDFKIYRKINDYNLSFALKNTGIILEKYTQKFTEIPLISQFSIIKNNRNKNLYFGYDIVYHFNVNNIEHILCLYANINNYTNIIISGTSYRKKLRIDNLNTDILYGIGFGINIKTKHNNKIDIGISSLGSAGYLYGLTFNF